MPDRKKINFCSKVCNSCLQLKLFGATVTNADTANHKSLHTLFDYVFGPHAGEI